MRHRYCSSTALHALAVCLVPAPIPPLHLPPSSPFPSLLSYPPALPPPTCAARCAATSRRMSSCRLSPGCSAECRMKRSSTCVVQPRRSPRSVSSSGTTDARSRRRDERSMCRCGAVTAPAAAAAAALPVTAAAAAGRPAAAADADAAACDSASARPSSAAAAAAVALWCTSDGRSAGGGSRRRARSAAAAAAPRRAAAPCARRCCSEAAEFMAMARPATCAPSAAWTEARRGGSSRLKGRTRGAEAEGKAAGEARERAGEVLWLLLVEVAGGAAGSPLCGWSWRNGAG